MIAVARLLAIVLWFGCAAPASAPKPATEPRPLTDRASIISLRDRFLIRASASGFVLPFVPEIREWTRPSLVSWRQEAKAVAVPRWDELDAQQRQFVVGMASGADARALFELLFRWFLIPHELTHALQVNAGRETDHATSERVANDVAVAFLVADNRAQLVAFVPVLQRARQSLPSLAELGDRAAQDRYFDDHYDELGRDPARYGAFQLQFILDSIARLDTLTFDAAIAPIAPVRR